MLLTEYRPFNVNKRLAEQAVKENTPLLKATVLMLTHDLNQLAVVDFEGAIVGTITPSIVARHLPRYIL